MDYLQYLWETKWQKLTEWVLNLIINGLPSIPQDELNQEDYYLGF